MQGEVVCRICTSRQSTLIYEGAEDYITGECFSVQRCASCGVAVTIPSPESTERYYPMTYRRYGRVSNAILRWLYSQRVRLWLRSFSTPGTALEVGCGDGSMLRVLMRRGWSVVGTERSLSSAAHARHANGVPSFVGGLDALQAKPGFDLILLFQVLEHLPDPMRVLEHCTRLLKPAGRLIISVPNFESWQSKLFGPNWFHLDVPRHIVHFSPASLRTATGRAGLVAGRATFVSFEHDPYGWIQSGLNRLGFRPNHLTRTLMGMDGRRRVSLATIAMVAVAIVGAIPSLLLAFGSWWNGTGAIMEVWCMRGETSA